jgi:iron complex outermembrane receptor protein
MTHLLDKKKNNVSSLIVFVAGRSYTMMESILSRSVRLICLGGAAVGLQAAHAQQPQGAPADDMQRVVVTGSSIKRIAAEGALPVTIVTADQIRASGVTSAADLVAKLAVVQGSTGETASVGAATFGFSGISIHNIGETRTLVLLNGKRLANFGGQTLTGFAAGFDLNAIPLSAIDRVELLTDGASALYGADAIAGVVNFITRHDRTDGDATVGYSHPKGGGIERRASVSKGFGDLDADGYNVMLTYGHDERTQLLSGARPFADTGQRTFSQNGKNYRIQAFSASPIPANALDNLNQLISPFQRTTGSCPPKTFRVTRPYKSKNGEPRLDDYCGYDYVRDLQLFPARQRDQFLGSATARLGGQELYADVLLSRTTQVSRIAPVPGQIPIDAGTPLHQRYLAPLGITANSLAYYRLFDLGNRTSDDAAKFASVTLGARGNLAGWDYNASYGFSGSFVTGSISGYPGALAVRKLAGSGLLDPFVGPGEQSPDAQQAIDAIDYDGYWNGGISRLHALQGNASRELTHLAGGGLMLGLGANVNREQFAVRPSLFAQGKLADPVAGIPCGNGLACDGRFGDAASSPVYAAGRTSQGVFAELIAPVASSLELGGAVRWDHYSDFGSATTAKASFKWTATRSLMVRGSVGTGFHAPTVPQVAALPQGYGVTSNQYACSPAMAQLAARENAVCRPANSEYDVVASGTRDLRPEKSRQATLGVRYEPNGTVTLGADVWTVGIRDVFGQLKEDVVFADPLRYAASWTSYLNVGTGRNYLAFLANNQNLGKYYASGIDWDLTARYRTPAGPLNSTLRISTMLRERQQLGQTGPYYSAIGNFAETGAATFRNRGTWTNTLKTGAWATTLTLNFQSGYLDQATTVQVLGPDGNPTGAEQVRVPVAYFSTWDLQTVWNPARAWSLTLGALNVFDRAPPFVPSLSHRGHQQFGYDDRYYDARGRTLYANASYRF